ncbi:MAG: DUF5058 family protein [Saccharofermentanales bacterium]|jgi:hypothetical protein
MSILEQLNRPGLFLVSGTIILLVAVICIIFMVRAYRAGKKLGMSEAKLKRIIVSSASFTVLPSIGILLGVIALSGSLGVPLPWLRLSVIGALHYETQIAEVAAEQVGLTKLSATQMTPTAFATIGLLMTVCIMWGMVLAVFFSKSYLKKLKTGVKSKRHRRKKAADDVVAAKAEASAPADEAAADAPPLAKKQEAPLGDLLMNGMFIGLISNYIGSYIGRIVSGEGFFTFQGDPLPLIVSLVAAAAMAGFIYLSEKRQRAWVENFSLAGSMLIAMIAAVLIKL